MPTLYLMLGYPGAGKTTIARKIADQTGAVHLSSDDVRLELFPQPDFSQREHDEVYRELDARTRAHLEAGRSVIYDANLNRKMHRQEKYDLCQTIGAKSALIWVQTEKALAKQRRIEEVEKHHLVPGHEDPGSMFERLVDVFEAPDASEPHFVINGRSVTDEAIAKLLA